MWWGADTVEAIFHVRLHPFQAILDWAAKINFFFHISTRDQVERLLCWLFEFKFRNQNSSESNHSVLLHTYLSLLAKVRERSWVKLRESERSWVEREVELWEFIFSFTSKVEVELRLATHFHPDVRQQRCYEPRMSPIQLPLLWLNVLVLSWAGPICWARKWGPWKFWRRWHASWQSRWRTVAFSPSRSMRRSPIS